MSSEFSFAAAEEKIASITDGKFVNLFLLNPLFCSCYRYSSRLSSPRAIVFLVRFFPTMMENNRRKKRKTRTRTTTTTLARERALVAANEDKNDREHRERERENSKEESALFNLTQMFRV